MGYYVVKAVKSKRRSWKLQVETRIWDSAEQKEYKTVKEIPPKQMGTHGFHPGMTIEQAKETRTRKNEIDSEKKKAESAASILDRIYIESRETSEYVPDAEEFVEWCANEHRIDFMLNRKLESHWSCAKNLLKLLKLKPEQYYDSRRRIYGFFASNGYSIEYFYKVVRFVNLYGFFHSRKYKTFFQEVPYPKGKDKEEINDAYFEKNGTNASLPLTPALLGGLHGKISDKQYNWMYLSLYLGLRPLEVDLIADLKRVRIEKDEHGTTVVKVYQSKLVAVPREQRWKLIPLLLPEQKAVPEIIAQGVDRPLVKTLTKHLGEGFSLYAGRKGFEAMMSELEHPIDHVSSWLGHQSLDTTWKKYRNRKVARYKKPA